MKKTRGGAPEKEVRGISSQGRLCLGKGSIEAATLPNRRRTKKVAAGDGVRGPESGNKPLVRAKKNGKSSLGSKGR